MNESPPRTFHGIESNEKRLDTAAACCDGCFFVHPGETYSVAIQRSTGSSFRVFREIGEALRGRMGN